MESKRSVHILIIYAPDGLIEYYRLHFTSERKTREYAKQSSFKWNDGVGMMPNTLTGSLACYTVHPLH